MLAFAENEFFLSKTETGFEANNRETLKHLEKALDKPNEKLELSRNPPKTFLYVWFWFIELYAGENLTFQEIKAWSDLKSIKLKALELNILTKLTKLANAR
ncbi:MAG: hypothetical protein NF693_08980 [Bombella sp.]|nr:hypothetical protein [Bombella sp.]